MARTREEQRYLRRAQRVSGSIMIAGAVIGISIAGFRIINTVVLIAGLYLVLTKRLFMQ